MRKKNENLKKELLQIAKQIIENEGVDAIHIRNIAKQAGIATGTVYNYFSNKEDILLALTQEYWEQALKKMYTVIESTSFSVRLKEAYDFLYMHIKNQGSMLMHSLSNVQTEGQQQMHAMQQILKNEIVNWLLEDQQINKKIWTDEFTKEAYAQFVLINMVTSLRNRMSSIQFFLQIVDRTLYVNEIKGE